MNINALLNTLSSSCRTLPIVILYVTEGCNLRCMTCSYRNALPNELSLSEIIDLADGLKDFGLRHIIYSGGEPLMRRDFPDICVAFSRNGIKQTLLTNGLMLEKRFSEIEQHFSEIIISLDGPNDEIHNGIRGVDSFGSIVKGVKKAIELRGKGFISFRTVIQKRNFRYIIDMVKFAKATGVGRISFLAADILSDSFGRDTRGTVAPKEAIMLDEEETHEFRAIAERMKTECAEDFQTRFISESHEKLLHIVQYYEALIRKAPFPRNLCNAPMVSTVITSIGMLQPCFFLPPFANMRDGDMQSLLNREDIRSTRQQVRAYEPEQCKTCVCTLHMSPVHALLDHF